jgi:hypothetical protein
MSWGITAVGLMLEPPLDSLLGFPTVLVSLFRPICLLVAVLRWGLPSVFLLVDVAFLPVGIAFLISPVVLRRRKHRRSQQQSQY